MLVVVGVDNGTEDGRDEYDDDVLLGYLPLLFVLLLLLWRGIPEDEEGDDNVEPAKREEDDASGIIGVNIRGPIGGGGGISVLYWEADTVWEGRVVFVRELLFCDKEVGGGRDEGGGI